MNDRRTNSTGLARTLFNDQLRRLLLLGMRYRRRKKHQEKLDVSVELLVDHTEAKLRIISDYKKQLRDCVKSQIQFVNQQANRLFNPLEINKNSFNDNPLLEGLFYGEYEFFHFFKQSRKLNNAIKDKSLDPSKPVYVLIKVFKNEKVIFAPSLVNGQVINDVRQTKIDFSKKSVVSFTQQKELQKELIVNHLHLTLIDYMKIRLNPLLAESKGKVSLIDEKDSDNPNVYLHHLKSLMLSERSIIAVDEIDIRTNRFGIVASEDTRESIEQERRIIAKQVIVTDEKPYLLLSVTLKMLT